MVTLHLGSLIHQAKALQCDHSICHSQWTVRPRRWQDSQRWTFCLQLQNTQMSPQKSLDGRGINISDWCGVVPLWELNDVSVQTQMTGPQLFWCPQNLSPFSYLITGESCTSLLNHSSQFKLRDKLRNLLFDFCLIHYAMGSYRQWSDMCPFPRLITLYREVFQ